MLLGEAIKKAPSKWPHLQDYNELVHGDAAGAPDRGRLLDKPFDADNTGFIGSGRAPRGDDLHAVKVMQLMNINLSLGCNVKGYWKGAED